MNCYLFNDVNVCNCDEGFELISIKNLTKDFQTCQGNFIYIISHKYILN